MNKTEFEVEMKRHKDNQSILSHDMGIARITLSRKINESNGASFTQPEIVFLKKRWKLSAQRVDEIFFDSAVS